jgi:DNA-binding PadR family transcriptional regulator
MKFALLELLRERPMYGYEMMKALEEKSGGFYTPSAGSIYPTLQMLEDRGFVTSKETEGKRVYSITDAGRALLSERQKNEEEFAGPPWARHHGFWGQRRSSPEVQALRSEAMEVIRLLTIAGRMAFQDPEQLNRLRAVIERTRKDLTDMIYASGSQQQQGQSSSTASAQQYEGPSVEEA